MANQLSAATSPYLLQHRDNPVHWHEWNEEAFARARRENKPVFLSIGYSTCHWCHVMAHESFENADVAAVLNEFFVSIKVDREERPDIDRLYMAFVQATTGSGGWPMSVWLTPRAEPFFGGTYFPPTDRHGHPGFVTVLERIAELWAQEPARIGAQGAEILTALRETATPLPPTAPINDSPLRSGLEAFAESYDAVHGGFGGGPKFPRPSVIDFLFRMPARGHAGALEKALHTLRRMAAGGMRDHLGGGFHRYSVDGRWHVPHFEKMLYDQAQLVNAYVDAWKITGDEAFAAVVRDTLAYVQRDLTHPLGGFFSAEDADSRLEHGKPAHAEGAFYVWDRAEIEGLLGPDEADIFCRRFGVRPGGNVDPAADPHQEFAGKNILFDQAPKEDLSGLASSRSILFEARAARPRPHLDDKILAAWNALMISAFASAGAALGEPEYVAIANRAAAFIRENLFDAASGELLRTWRDGRAGIRAFAEDYAFLVQALLDLYEANLDPAWLSWAQDLQMKQDTLFFDEATGCYLGSAKGDPLLPLRLRDDYDGAEPSANSVSARNLLRLAWIQQDQTFSDRAQRIIASFGTILTRMPSAVPQMLVSLDMALTPPRECVIAGQRDAADTRALLAALHRRFAPNRVVLFAGDTTGSAEMRPVSGAAALYVCENFACQAPVTDPAAV